MGPLFGIAEMSPDIAILPGSKDVIGSAQDSPFLPMDSYNKLLINHVHPPDYINPLPSDTYDLVAIGAGGKVYSVYAVIYLCMYVWVLM